MKSFLALSLISLLLYGAERLYAEAPQPLRIGWIGPLSGPVATLGVDCVPAMQMVFEEANRAGGIHGRPIELVYEDDQYVTHKTVTAYRKLVTHHKISVIVAVTYGGLFAVAQQAQRDDALLIDTLDCDEAIAKLPANTFCIAKLTEDMGRANADDMLARGLTPAAFIYHDADPFMPTAAKATQAELKRRGGTWVLSEGVLPGTVDFQTLLLKVKQAQARSLALYGYDDIGIAMRQARALGIEIPFYAVGTLMSKAFQESAGDALNGVRFPLWQAPRDARYQDFLARFKQRVGREPFIEISSVPSYDAAAIIVEALRALGPKSSRDKIDVAALREHLYKVRDYQGLSGSISIDPDGATRSLKVRMYEWENGTFNPPAIAAKPTLLP